MAGKINLTADDARILVDVTEVESSGVFVTANVVNSTLTSVAISSADCDAWGSPSRIALQVLMLLMMLLNVAAAIVVFGVPVNVRGRHVAFLFICVRTLNILDMYQCAVIFFFPFGMPTDCVNPGVIYCNISGFCFGTATILSPLVAIVMALDRFIAVFFHVRYKARPQTKLKCGILAIVIGCYCFYFTLPFYTNFGKFIAVPWLSLCSFEWGEEYRLFNLLLALVTTILTMILMAANLAILIKVRQRKKEIEKMKASSRKPNDKKGIRMKRQISNGSRNGFTFRKSKSVDDLKDTDDTEKGNSTRSLSERRGKKVPPLRIFFSGSRNSSPRRGGDSVSRNDSSELPSISPAVNTDSADELEIRKSHLTHPSCTVVLSPIPPSPLTNENTLLFPRSASPNQISPDAYRPPSPLIMNEDGLRNPSPRMVTKQTILTARNRVSSTDSLLDGREIPLSTFGHRLNDPNVLRKKALGNINTGKRTASSEPVLDRSDSKSGDEGGQKAVGSLSRESSTANSLLSNFIGNRLMSWRSRAKRPAGVRRHVSRITKMTTAICTLFAVLYVPFLIRKLIQVIPYEYYHVSLEVEIATLFGPLLSPLFNPILYVFFNPHYRENCKRLYRRLVNIANMRATSDDLGFTVTSTHRSWRRKSSRRRKKSNGISKRQKVEISETEHVGARVEQDHHSDEVFVAAGIHKHFDGVSVSDTPNEDSDSDTTAPIPLTQEETKRRQSLRQLHLRRIQNLHFRRANSDEFLN